ncbi:transposase [Acinetobacter indicus]|uniref:transposase n=1 Tax=Acinetobacter indicus TaxID=756892 RepID=UPI00197C00A4|nr:transposase [Acinetobacter indicus]QSG83619.1 transposase [Acinetobacter indicus]
MLNNVENWQLATAVNGQEIFVKVMPLKKKQRSSQGFIWVEVGKMIELQSGQQVEFNLDGKSFYVALNQLYKLN